MLLPAPPALTQGLAPYLPLRVEMELDLNSSSSLSAIRGDAVSSTTPAPTAVPLCAHVLGPVQPAPTAAALRLLEDLLIEDCDHNRLCINALHCADLDLRGVAVGGEETLDLARRSGSTSGIEEGNLRAQSNAFLDLLVSPVTANARRTAGASPGGKLEGGVASTALSAAAATTHVVTFLNNFVKGRGPQLTTLHFETPCEVQRRQFREGTRAAADDAALHTVFRRPARHEPLRPSAPPHDPPDRKGAA